MSRSMHELLSQVNSAEPDPRDWAAIAQRVSATLANPAPADLQRAETVADSLPTSPLLPRSSGVSLWVAGSVAAGVVLVGLAFVGARGLPSPSREAETVTSEPLSVTAERVVDVAGRAAERVVSAPAAATLAVPVDGADSHGALEPELERRVPARPKSKQAARNSAARSGVATAGPEKEEVESEYVAPPAPLGESDVEYDRRHLVPIDAALQAHQPQEALKLLAGFKPRKLTHFAAGLHAIALCDAGYRPQGQSLAMRNLPKLGHRGLVRRVEVACGVKAPTEPTP